MDVHKNLATMKEEVEKTLSHVKPKTATLISRPGAHHGRKGNVQKGSLFSPTLGSTRAVEPLEMH